MLQIIMKEVYVSEGAMYLIQQHEDEYVTAIDNLAFLLSNHTEDEDFFLSEEYKRYEDKAVEQKMLYDITLCEVAKQLLSAEDFVKHWQFSKHYDSIFV